MAATLTKPNSSAVTRSTAKVAYNVTGYSLPSNETGSWSTTSSSDSSETQKRTITKYSDIKYSWSFGSTSQSGTTTFNISAGQANSLSAKVTITCTKEVTTETRTRTRSYVEATETTEGHWGSWSSWDTSSSSSSSTYTIANNISTNTITVYGLPNEFSWGSGVATDKTIQTSAGLSASKWNTLVERTELHTNWKNQSSGANYSRAEVSSGDIITASTYNIIANALSVSTVSSGTLITAQVFINLQTAVNK